MSDKRILLGTRKGLITLGREAGSWRIRGCDFEGVPCSYAMRDARDGRLHAALGHGHWGVKLHRSEDDGANWSEVAAPAYPEDAELALWQEPGKTKPAKLEQIWCLTPGGPEQPGRLWAGTLPGGLFRSDDGGDSWELVRGLWDMDTRMQWFGGGADVPGIHSVLVDPRDPAHVTIGVSCAGVLESRDDGASWSYRNRGMRAEFLPDPEADVGQDPHVLSRCAADPDVIWQQNHCGIYRSTDDSASWTTISESGQLPHFGFAVLAHPERPKTAWVVPAVSDVQRTAIERKLVVCRSDDGGASWQEQRNGLPQEDSWDIVFRHALDGDGELLAFGTTTGNVFVSENGGAEWNCAGRHFPPVYSVRLA